MNGEHLAAAALALVGAPFLPHGRDPATGLDCVGVLATALAAIGRRHAHLPTGYTLRARRVDGIEAAASGCGLVAATGDRRAGDVIIVRPAPCQLHLLIVTARDRCVHAHAGLRRVIAGPIPEDWPVASHWRLAESV